SDGPSSSKASNTASEAAGSLSHDDALLQPSSSSEPRLGTIGPA
ncbi:hypothetical protein V6N11_019949, partial [Hibiscus sabdariffa]